MPLCFLFSSFASVKYFFPFYIYARALALCGILNNVLQTNIENHKMQIVDKKVALQYIAYLRNCPL